MYRPPDSIRAVDLSFATLWFLWEKVWAFLGPAGNFVQWLYNVNGRFHLSMRRAWFWVANSTARWDASFSLSPQDGQNNLGAILGILVDKLRHGSGFQILRETAEHKVVRTGGLILEISVVTGVLHIQISDQAVSFRDSKKIITGQLLPLVETVENTFQATEKHYSLTAKFPSKENPYLATLLRRIDRDLINTFNCTYNTGQATQRVIVSVNLDSVSVVAKSRESFRTESLKILALSGP